MSRRSKDVLLLVLALVALIVALYTFRRKPAPVTQAKPVAAAKTEVAKPAEGEAKPAPVSPGAAGETRNPFAGPGAAGAVALPEATAKPPAPAAAQPPVTPAPTVTATPPVTPLPPPTAAGVAAPEQELALAGIVAGRRNMAVIREGDKRYYASVGDRIGGYRVQAIGEHEVVLAGREGKVILRMGGRQ
jgi:hypothetical protein